MEYTLIRSRRKTTAVEIKDGRVIVRAPVRFTRAEADALVKKHERWIAEKLSQQKRLMSAAEQAEKLSQNELRELYERAAACLPALAEHYAGLLGESFGRVTIRCQRTRWGSCSAKRNLNFNCLLMLTPERVIDSVVAHEVCHLREMNHSPRFYELLSKLCPDHRECDEWLKNNGRALLARVSRER